MGSISTRKLNRNRQKTEGKSVETPATVDELRAKLLALASATMKYCEEQSTAAELPSHLEFEQGLRDKINEVGLAAEELFLGAAEERVKETCKGGMQFGERFMRPAPGAQFRNLATLYGVARYSRTYLRESYAGRRCGFHPLDSALGLPADRFSWNVLSMTVRLSTKMSYAEAKETAASFLPSAPSTEVIEKAVLGLGKHTGDWFAATPAPEGDGDVLIIMIDSKGAPTATLAELRRRRGKRSSKQRAPSPRHRGRVQRQRYPKKARRKKGDKSKNAKMATLVVMYTLKRQGGLLLGPLNRLVYASFAPKEHAFAIARREADKRGFDKASGRIVQIVTDGDTDLACYAQRHFPEARHTVDIIHVIERLWTIGECLHKEGTPALAKWVARQKQRLRTGKVHLILDETRRILERTPQTGPGNKGKRERLSECLRYLAKRVDQMHYDELIAMDLEIASGQVEGAVKNVIGKRCDHGGMRWIKERAEALLQLRCIEINGHWDAFIRFVHDRLREETSSSGLRVRLQAKTPAPLPDFRGEAEAA